MERVGKRVYKKRPMKICLIEIERREKRGAKELKAINYKTNEQIFGYGLEVLPLMQLASLIKRKRKRRIMLKVTGEHLRDIQ